MTSNTVVPQDRIYIMGYKLDTSEDFDKAIHGLRHTMQVTLDTLALSGHYERMIVEHPSKSIDDAAFMNLVLNEIRLVQNNKYKFPLVQEEVKKKRVYKKRSKQLTLKDILGE